MKNSDIVNYNEVFLILAFIILMIMATPKLSPSYATSLTPSQVNAGPHQDEIKQIVDTNAFSNLSRNMTSSTGNSGQSLISNATDTTSSVSSKSSAFVAGGNSNSTIKVGGVSNSASDSNVKSIHHGPSGSRPHHANSGGSSSRSGGLSTSSSSSG
jgi:hypothetical protein